MKDASIEEEVIRGWWKQWPQANVGVLTGYASGLLVLDVDPRHGGKESLVHLEERHGELPPTFAVETGGAGHHFYFHHPGLPLRSRVGLRPGVDLKGEGGYVVAPPSLHASGRAYRVADGMSGPLAAVPNWLVRLERERHGADGTAANPGSDDAISEGRRNATLTSLAGTMRARGMTPEAIEAALIKENAGRCAPPLPDTEVQRIAESVSRYPSGLDASATTASQLGDSAKPQATRLVALAKNAQLFHSPDGDAFATFKVARRRETSPLRGRAFRTWLVQQFFASEKRAPAGRALQDALTALEGFAIHGAPCQTVHVRLAEHENVSYLDLANELGEAVELTSQGWRTIPEPPVKFLRPPGVAPLPTPLRGGAVSELRAFVNVPANDDTHWRLMVGWLLAALRPVGPYPILVLTGEAGSAKTTTARVLRTLVDPSRALMRAEPRNERDLMIAATNSWVIALDNVSHLHPWIADALCRLATGGGLTTRKLYTDAEEQIFDVQRPVILTGIEDPTTRGDLLDRALVLRLPSIPERGRRPESQLWTEIAAARPRLLGALLDALVAGMANLPTTCLDCMPRMADFALLGTAAESGLGWERGAFLEAYVGNRQATNDLALEYSPITEALFELVESGPWIGTPSDLLKRLTAGRDERVVKQHGWPSNARGMRSALERLAPNLRAAGVEVKFLPRRGRGRPLEVRRVGTEATSPSRPSPPSPDLLNPLDTDLLARPFGAGDSDGEPDQVTDGPGGPSPATAYGEGASDGDDGGDGQPGASTPVSVHLDLAWEPGDRPETPRRPSEATSGGRGRSGAEEPAP